MRQFAPENSEGPQFSQLIVPAFHGLTTAFGILLIAVGIYFACQIFGIAYSAVADPESLGASVEQWTEYVSGGEPMLELDDRARLNPRIVALCVLGFCMLVMIWVTKAAITTGAKIVYWMGSDVDSVKRVLSHVFGPTVIDVVKGPTEKPPSPFEKPEKNPNRP